MAALAGPPGAEAGTVVILCGDLEDGTPALAPGRLRDRIRERFAADVLVHDGRLCGAGALPRPAGPRKCVVVCRRGSERRDELISRLHREGWRFDAVDVVGVTFAADVPPAEAALATERAVHAAIAGLHAEPYPMLSPERPAGAPHPSRRAVLTASASARLPMPALDASACRASTGCDRCIAACPEQAITMTSQVPHIDASRCTGCAACASSCPSGAWRLAGSSGRQLAARLAALLDEEGLPAAGIMLRCRDAAPPELGHEWAEIVLPSIPAIGPGTILQAVLGGASAVHLEACEDATCRGAADGLAELVNTTLRAAARPPVVTSLPAAPPRTPRRPPVDVAGVIVGEIREPAATLAALVALTGGAAVRVAHPAAPLALIRADAAVCTACEACVLVCPTGALSVSIEGEWVLGYDPRRCVGCDLCSRTCPEHALTVEKVLDTALLAAGDVVLCRRTEERCPACGRPDADLPVRLAAAARLAHLAPAAATLAATTCGRCGPASLGADLPSGTP